MPYPTNLITALVVTGVSGQATGAAGGMGVAVYDPGANGWLNWGTGAFDDLGAFPLAGPLSSDYVSVTAAVETWPTGTDVGSGEYAWQVTVLPAGMAPSRRYLVHFFPVTDSSTGASVGSPFVTTVELNAQGNDQPSGTGGVRVDGSGNVYLAEGGVTGVPMGSYNLWQIIYMIYAVLTNTSSGSQPTGTSTMTIYEDDGTTAAITGTIDPNGNRTATTKTPPTAPT